ncbi:MAG: inner membrane CreD family protein, partial [Phycisphaerae bacterium]|nr:inner membrane CreD family protein [Phycisphaerae bacterium]
MDILDIGLLVSAVACLAAYPFAQMFAFFGLLGHLSGPREFGRAWRILLWVMLVVLPTSMVVLYEETEGTGQSDDLVVAWGAAMLVLTICLARPRWLYSILGVLSAFGAAAVACGYVLEVRREELMQLFPAAAAGNFLLLGVVILRGLIVGLGAEHRDRSWREARPKLPWLPWLPGLNIVNPLKELNMSTNRFIAIGLIYLLVSGAWLLLGGAMDERTESLDDELSAEIYSLVGPPVVAQWHPFWAENDTAKRDDPGSAVPSAATVAADIEHENRYKGLLWYSTFTVDFRGEYTLPAGGTGASDGVFRFELPPNCTPIDLAVAVDGEPVDLSYAQKTSGHLAVPVSRDVERRVTVAFKTMGQNTWQYTPADSLSGPRGELQNFALTVTTDFEDIDYPTGGRSPNEPATDVDGGKRATWAYENIIAAQPMGVVMPQRANAGPIVARMSFFAPVSLLFFFTVLFIVVVKKSVVLHPMHYLFIAAGFFAFHILLAYTADRISIHLAFWISAVVSVLLVVSYLRLVAGLRFALLYAGAAQLVYLVGFCYAFFWVGMTGLTITVVAILTLFVLMQATGRLDWAAVFAA